MTSIWTVLSKIRSLGLDAAPFKKIPPEKRVGTWFLNYEQTFRATAPGLCRVDVLFATFGRVNTTDVVFRLKESLTSEVDLVTRTVSASLLHDNRFFSFAFNPLPDSEGRRYYFSIESPDVVRGDAVGLWAHLNPADAPGGMYENDRAIAGRLAHAVQYERTVLLTAIGRICYPILFSEPR